MNKHIVFILAILAFTLGMNRVSAQEQQAYKVGLVGFYNLENLFDTIDDPMKIDEEFLPQGLNQWNTEKYLANSIIWPTPSPPSAPTGRPTASPF